MTLIALLVLRLLVPLSAQAETVHGSDSIFVSPGVSITWGVLRGPTEDAAVVVTRVSNPTARYAYLSVDGVNPFTGARTAIVEGVPLGERADVRSPRAGFADFPRREIHLYATEEQWRARKPALTVYYLGVPDTTPEFTTQAALDAYLTAAQPPGR